MSFWRYAGYGVALLFGGAVAYNVYDRAKKLQGSLDKSTDALNKTSDTLNKGVTVDVPQLDSLLKQAQAILANPAGPAATSAATIAAQAVKAAQDVLAHPATSAGAPPGTPTKAAQDAATQAAALAQQALNAAQDPATQQQAVELANQAAQAAAQAQKSLLGG